MRSQPLIKSKKTKRGARGQKWPYNPKGKGVWKIMFEDVKLHSELARLADIHDEPKKIEKMMTQVGSALSQFAEDWENMDFRPPNTKKSVLSAAKKLIAFRDAIEGLDKTITSEIDSIQLDHEPLHPLDWALLRRADIFEKQSKSLEISEQKRMELRSRAKNIRAEIESEQKKTKDVSKIKHLYIGLYKFNLKIIIWLDRNGNIERRSAPTQKATQRLCDSLFKIFLDRQELEIEKTDELHAALIDDMARFAELILDARGIKHPSFGQPDRGEEHRGRLGKAANKYYMGTFLLKSK